MKRSIFRKTLLSMLLLSVLTAALVSFASIQYQSYYIERSLVEESKVFASIAGKAVEAGYLIDQWPLETLKRISDLKEVAFLWVVSPEGEIFLADDPEMWGKIIDEPDLNTDEMLIKDSFYSRSGEKVKLIIYPIFLERRNYLLLGASLNSVAEARNAAILTALGFLLLILIFAAFLSFRFARGLAKPIASLTEGAKAIGKGNLDYRIDIKTGDEMESLAVSFNEMSARLKEQRKREKALAKTKSEFISIAAHQLRTPLSAVKWTLRMLLDGDLGDVSGRQKEFLTMGYQANERMIRLVNSLLNVSRIEEGKFGFNFVKQDFVAFLKDVVDSFVLEAREGNIELRADFPREPIEAVFDPERLRMALSNLLDNAILYTLPGGRVSVSVEREKSFLKVIIKDSGIGISAEQRPKIFNKFARGDNAVRLQTEGSGLGLYLARNIVRRHGGEIWFDSQEGRGSTFYLTIPVEEKMVPTQKVFEQTIAGL